MRYIYLRAVLMKCILATSFVHAQQERPEVCDPGYYTKIAQVSKPHYLVGKPHTYENEWDPTGATFESVDCKVLAGSGLTLVTVKLRNTKGELGEIEAGSDHIPQHLTTETAVLRDGERERKRIQELIAEQEGQMKGYVGKTLILSKKFGGLPAGTPIHFMSVSFVPSNYWQFDVKTTLGARVQMGTSDDWKYQFSNAYTPVEFSRLRIADQRAIRSQLWTYGMSQNVLRTLLGSPDHINDYDGKEQWVYEYGSSSSYFYFDTRGSLTSHQSMN